MNAQGRERSRWAILALITVAHALGSLSVLAAAPLSPFLLDALELSRTQVGLFLPALYLGGVLASLPAGWLSDRLGVRRALVLGQGLTGAAVGLAALSPSFAVLLGFLFLGGFGWSVLNPTTGKAVIEWFPPRERGFAMGVKQTGLTLGGIAGALVLPPLALALGWRLSLAVAGAASLLSAALVAFGYRTRSGYLAEAPPERPRFAEVTPFLQRRGVLVVFGCGLALSMAQSSVLAYLVLYAKEVLAVSVVDAGRLLALAQAGGAAARLGWGLVSDRLFGGRRRPGIIVTALIGATSYIAFAFGGALPSRLAAPLAVIAGAGAFGWVGLYLALVAEIAGVRYAGLLTGVAVMFAWSGVLVGPPLFGVVLEATGSYVGAWLLLSAYALLVAAALSRLQPLVQRG
ncbi:MAG: MFS transporter [Candidatus Rokubacteria bacterium]|nr:MFS transporter [Candidatus Rokubacteria bacterium]